MKMANDKVFNTGNHPVEMPAGMLHFVTPDHFDIVTANGDAAVVLEMWAYPSEDET
jgi:molecular chaperone Hsp31 and glyoxalase 3